MKKIKHPQNNIDAKLSINIGQQACEFSIRVPEDKSGPEVVLPFARDLTDKTVEIAVNDFLKDGKTISCEKGCGACCVQLVPIAEVEAREIAKLIKSYPKEKKSALLAKFNAAKETFEKAGLWNDLSHPENIADEDTRELGMRYFAQQVPCPFLEDGACSIHPVRPLSCREFLVTSPAIHCSNPNENDVVSVDMPQRISNALGSITETDTHFKTNWVPLILAPFWQQLHPSLPSKKTGPEWVEALLKGKFSEQSDY